MTEIQGACLEQLSLIQDQPVRVLDSCRGDWWLVCTIPEDEETEGVAGDRPKEGWVRADLLAEEGKSLVGVAGGVVQGRMGRVNQGGWGQSRPSAG